MSKHGKCFRCNQEIDNDYIYGGKLVGSYVDFTKKETGKFRIPLCIECISYLTEHTREGGPDIEDMSEITE